MPERSDTLVVVLGAGASHDPLPHNQSLADRVRKPIADGFNLRLLDVLPPLTDRLFEPGPVLNTLLARYPDAVPLVQRLRLAIEAADANKAPWKTLEERLGEEEARATMDPTFRRHLIAVQFLLRDLLVDAAGQVQSIEAGGGVTNHSYLVDRLSQWVADGNNRRVLYVNMNYDTLLEDACTRQWGFHPGKLDSYLTNPCGVMKPHGSTYWGLQHSMDAKPKRGYDANVRAQINGDDPASLELNSVFAVGHEVGPGNTSMLAPWVPALALPVKEKTTFVMPPEHMQAAERDWFWTASRLMVIGWRALDRHVLTDLIAKLAGPEGFKRGLIVTGGDDAKAREEAMEVEAQISEHRALHNFEREHRGFRSLFRAGSSRLDTVLGEHQYTVEIDPHYDGPGP